MSSPGWYPQPDGNERYYDGNEWTEHIRTPNAMAPMAPHVPPAEKSGMMKWIIVAVVAVVVLCCCGGAALSLGGDSDDSASSESTSVSESVESSETEAPDAPSAKESSGTSEPSAKESSGTSEPSAKESSSTKTSSTKTPESEAPASADYQVTAGELMEEFEGNELAGDRKYKGKTVQVSGVVEKIDTELFDDDKYLLNITDGGEFEFLSVTCHDMDNDVLSELAVGNPITVVGDFDDGGDLGVDLKECKVV